MLRMFASKMDTMKLDLVVITLLCLGSLSNGQFTIRPKNLVAVRDTEVNFTCVTTAQPVPTSIIWWRSNGTVGFETIAYDGFIYPGFESYSVVYEPGIGTSSRSVLKLTGVLPTDAGTFQCRTPFGQALAQLVVFGSDPQVASNTTLSDVIEGETIGLSCSVPYYSAIRWAPTMNCRGSIVNDLTSINRTTENLARFDFSSTTHRNHTGQQFECAVNFGAIPEENIPVGIWGDHNKVPPTYEYTSKNLALTVYYPVENLQLTNPKDVYNPGERLTITADGRPGPSFSWTNFFGNTTVNGNILTVTAEMEGSQNWTYIAYNLIRGQRYEIDETHSFIVEIPTTTTTTTQATTTTPVITTTENGNTAPTEVNGGGAGGLSGGAIAGIVIGSLVGLALIILVIFCCISKNKAPKTTKDKTAKTNNVDTIRNQPQMVISPGDIAYIDKEKGPPPYNPYAPPTVPSDEGLVYAELAFEDKPRSRKPIQVFEPTEYGDIL